MSMKVEVIIISYHAKVSTSFRMSDPTPTSSVEVGRQYPRGPPFALVPPRRARIVVATSTATGCVTNRANTIAPGWSCEPRAWPTRLTCRRTAR